MNKNVAVLTLAQILAVCISPALMFIGAILGQKIAPSTELATLPIAAMVVGTAVGAYPLVRLMHQVGRKPVFIASILLIAVACLLIAFSLQVSSFFLYCLSIAVVGFAMAAVQQFRFAAMESVSTENMPKAASSVMLAGVAAAFVGPEIMTIGQHWLATEFMGSFLLIACAYLACAFLLLFYQQPEEHAAQGHGKDGTARQLFQEPLFWVAVFGAGTGFALMTFVMTATPISMHDHIGHSLEDTKWVIQSHVCAMFLPSLVLPMLIKRLGIQPVMVSGFACYALTIIIGLLNPGVWYYWFSLVFLGIGWNFLFVGATTLLPFTHKAQYHLKAQAVNDTIVFSLQAFAALCSGLVLNLWGWHTVLLACLPIIAAQLLLQYFCNRKHQQRTEKLGVCTK